jgi:beta-galactosidase
VATHASGWRQGLPAITLHRKGEGQVLYVGVMLPQAGVHAVVDWLCQRCGIKPTFARPEGVSIYERECEQYKLLFLINWTPEPQTVKLHDGWQDAFTQEPLDAVLIPPNDIRVARHDVAG